MCWGILSEISTISKSNAELGIGTYLYNTGITRWKKTICQFGMYL